MRCQIGVVAAIILGVSGFAPVQGGPWFDPACILSVCTDTVQNNGANNPFRLRIGLMSARYIGIWP